MEVAVIYTKERKEFGKHCSFSHVEAEVIDAIAPTDEYADQYVIEDPRTTEVDTDAHMSEHTANTSRLQTRVSSIRHVEGGWPKDVDFTEQSDVNRFRKKAEKNEDYKAAVKSLGPVVEQCMRQNNTMDIYEEYFSGEDVDHSSEPPSAKGLTVFRDPNETKRTVTSVNWHPEHGGKVAVSYSILNFQDPRFSQARLPSQSYIWDITNPNTPDVEINPPSPLCCLRYNPKVPDTLIGGSYNGLVSFYDLRRPGGLPTEAFPQETSLIESSHHDPVYDVHWISSKTGNQCASVSTDGQMLWWDTRKLSEPTDRILLSTDCKNNGVILGGSSLEYNSEAGPSKYLVGTEQGVVMMVNLKNRKSNNGVQVFDQGPGKHHGPIYSIHRNPANPKCFLTIGDWFAKVWMEDLRTPIVSTRYHPAYLTSGCWSPTRPGVFYVTRADGVLDIWDYYYRQNEVAYSHKVSDSPLSSIAVSDRLVAVGDTQGTVSLLEVCQSLSTPQPNEKRGIDAMFEREGKQEKNLELRARELQRRRGDAESKDESDSEARGGKDEKMEELLRKVDADFLAMIKEAEDDESRAVARSMDSSMAEEK
jgi:dynein intermediate chain 2